MPGAGAGQEHATSEACVADDEPQLVKRIVWMASEYGRYGYRRITALLRAEGLFFSTTRVEWILWSRRSRGAIRPRGFAKGTKPGRDGFAAGAPRGRRRHWQGDW
ncbi:MAG: transposase [Betaproteobacteria bacterium]|nr:transposase [Betaproteobacteria bacterium]